jgi:poly-gamma-glutamate capsule biosynthesis protein CapA/YwtB (metallophosphatase superfamily)
MYHKSLGKIIILLLLSVSVFAISTSYFLKNPVSSNKKTEVKKNNTDSIPLLLLSSHLNTRENLSTEELISLLKKGRILCTADLLDYCKNKFKLDKHPEMVVISKFNHADDSLFLLTSLDSLNHQFRSISVDSIDFFSNPQSYSLWVDTDHPFDFSTDITHYVHTGVTAITRSSGIVLDREGIDFYLKNIESYFKKSELTHISNEVSVKDQCDYGTMKMHFATKPAHFEIIKRLRANIIELTGNHNLDFGKEPYLNSLKWYESNNMQYFGGGKSPAEANRPLILELKDGSRVAWIGFNEFCPCGECADKEIGANRYSATKAKNLIDSLKKNANVSYIMACVQFGEADTYTPTPTQKNICKYLVDCGADVVLGSQAHQAQEIGLHKDKIIFYGLGNFLFDQIHRLGVRQAFFLNCFFYKGKIVQYQPVYTYMNDQRQPTVASEERKKEIQRSILKKYNFPVK